MKGSLAEELYSESLKLPKLELDSASNAENKVSGFQDSERDHSLHEDDSFWDGSDQELEKSSDLDRAWQRRREQFHTIGYRDGIIAGKEATVQEGFNIGFRESVSVGYKWGMVRGVTSALAVLPDALKGELIDTEERRRRTEFKKLHESTRSLSTTDALKLFNDSIVNKKSTEQGESSEVSSDEGDLHQQRAEQKQLESYYGEFQSLILKSPQIKIQSP